MTPAPTSDPAADGGPVVHRIPDWRMADLAARFARLARRADKIGVPAPTYTVVDTVEITKANDVYTTWVEVWHDVIVSGVSPHLPGYRLVAVIDRDLANPDTPNVVHAMPDVAMNLAWRTVGDVCDHTACDGAARGRKKICVVRHDDGTDRYVGTSCVASYLGGVDPNQVAAMLTYIEAVGAAGEYDDDCDPDAPRGHGAEVRYDTAGTLAIAAAMIETYGWTSKSAAWDRPGLTATVEDVLRFIDGKRVEKDPAITDAHHHTAAAAIAWAAAIEVDDSTSTYLANLNALAAKDTLRAKDLGTAVSMVPAHQRHLEGEARKAKAAEAGAASTHLGTVGKRMVITGEVIATHTYDSGFGTVTWVTVVTADGNVVKWKASGASRPGRGDVITGKATIKAHDDWKGTAQTVVTRWAWAIHPDHCEHRAWDAYGDLNADRRKKGHLYSCVHCGTPIPAQELLEMISAVGDVAVTPLVWRDGQLPVSRKDHHYGLVDPADRWSAGIVVPAGHSAVC